MSLCLVDWNYKLPKLSSIAFQQTDCPTKSNISTHHATKACFTMWAIVSGSWYIFINGVWVSCWCTLYAINACFDTNHHWLATWQHFSMVKDRRIVLSGRLIAIGTGGKHVPCHYKVATERALCQGRSKNTRATSTGIIYPWYDVSHFTVRLHYRVTVPVSGHGERYS